MESQHDQPGIPESVNLPATEFHQAEHAHAMAAQPEPRQPEALMADPTMANPEASGPDHRLALHAVAPDPGPSPELGRPLQADEAPLPPFDPLQPWPGVMNRLRENRKTQLLALLQKVIVSRLRAEDQVLVLPLRSADRYTRGLLEKPSNRKPLEDTVSEVFGGQWSIRCVTIDEMAGRSESDIAELNYLDDISAEVTARSRHDS